MTQAATKRKLLVIAILAWVSLPASAQVLRQFTHEKLTLYYEEHGRGPALYVLSGGPGEAPEHSYRQIVDSLKAYYTCILIHQRGSGRSRNIPINEKSISIANYTQDIERIRTIRGDRIISLLGVSWGGLLAMNYAAQHPRFVSSLILVCSAPPSYTLWNVLFDNQHTRRSPAELDSLRLLQEIFSAKTERELDSLKRSTPTSPEVVAYKRFMEIHVRAMYYDRSKISSHYVDQLFYSFNFQPIPIIDKEVLGTKWDITDKLRQLSIPVLIVYGRQDDQGESTFYLQKESLRNSEVYVIERCGHEILEEQPVEFFRILMAYVRRKAKPSR